MDPRPPAPSNDEIADVFERIADLLQVQEASSFRIHAYRAGARSLRETRESVARRHAEGGRAALEALPAIGKTLAAWIAELCETGGLAFLDRLEGTISAERLFATLPGVGDELAHRLHVALGVETLEDLELAAHDGRLDAVPGFGPRRVQAVRNALDQVLRLRSRRRVLRSPPQRRPTVALLLEVDRRYRAEAAAGTLRTIAPRRFNPEGRAWLPILHLELADPVAPGPPWSATALFSNTARAHQLGRTRDWVVIYAERDGEEERCTVVTETSGPLRGRRVVRGREAECARLHAKEGQAAEPRPSARGGA